MLSNELNEFIEDRGVFCAQKYLTPKISDFMEKHSTKPSLDGSLILRQTSGEKQGCVVIPIQVKGTFEVSKFNDNKAPVA